MTHNMKEDSYVNDSYEGYDVDGAVEGTSCSETAQVDKVSPKTSKHDVHGDVSADDSYGYCEADGGIGDDSTPGTAVAEETPPKSPDGYFARLFSAMRTALAGCPENIVSAMRDMPSPGFVPSPGTTWTLLSIVEHYQRQKWARFLLQEDMPEIMEPCEILYDFGPPVERLLPSNPDWKVSLECLDPHPYVILTHQKSGETINVDISPEGDYPILTLEHWLVERRLDEQIDPASSRLLELAACPTGEDKNRYRVLDMDWDIIHELRDNGFIEGGMYQQCDLAPDEKYPDYFVIRPEVLKHEDLALGFLRIWDNPANRIWAAGLIGDWPKAHELALQSGDEKLIRATADRARECNNESIRRARESLDSGKPGTRDFMVLYQLRAPELDGYIRRDLEEGFYVNSQLISFLNAVDDPRWCDEVFQCWMRITQDERMPPNGLLTYLLQHDHRTADLISTLARKGGQAG